MWGPRHIDRPQGIAHHTAQQIPSLWHMWGAVCMMVAFQPAATRVWFSRGKTCTIIIACCHWQSTPVFVLLHLCLLHVRPQRSRQGKRRYLLPDPPRPEGSGTAGAAGAGAAAAGACGFGSSSDGAGTSGAGNDADPSPDQIRPELKTLGDSVTSAVRYGGCEHAGSLPAPLSPRDAHGHLALRQQLALGWQNLASRDAAGSRMCCVHVCVRGGAGEMRAVSPSSQRLHSCVARTPGAQRCSPLRSYADLPHC